MKFIITAATLVILFSNNNLSSNTGKLPSGVVQWEKELIVIPNYAEVSCGEVK